jgi:hypothetical protein
LGVGWPILHFRVKESGLSLECLRVTCAPCHERFRRVTSSGANGVIAAPLLILEEEACPFIRGIENLNLLSGAAHLDFIECSIN